MKELIAVIITLCAGPLVFYYLSHRVYRTRPSFPVGAVDSVGDLLLLPLFNAAAVHYGVLSVIWSSPQKLLIAFTIAYILTRVFVIYRKDFALHNDWSRPKRGAFNAGGWYHAAFMFCQIFFMAATLLHQYTILLLWVPIAGFAILIGVRVLQVKDRKRV